MATNTNTTKATTSKTALKAAPKPTAPAPKAATTPAPATPATEAAKVTTNGNGDLYSKLALGATKAEAMPLPTKGNRKPNPLADLVQQSYDEKTPFALPPMENDQKLVDSVKAAVRRAAGSRDLGVNVTQQVQGDGQVIVFLQGKEKTVR
ncbi:hypothetical protein [Amycolatopsis sp. lyj-84]|uniref:hypothetical protein n=1 Tax=Amycolatopsis sp. lyj-84 TaxID=2789284 RepID=UPI00397E38C8